MDVNKEPKPDNPPQRRGLSWAAFVAMVILTLVAALIAAYLITQHNFPATEEAYAEPGSVRSVLR
jgi:hypothetical protein